MTEPRHPSSHRPLRIGVQLAPQHGSYGAYRDAVLLNAAAALIVAGRATGWSEGAAQAATAIDDQTALHLLERWIAYR